MRELYKYYVVIHVSWNYVVSNNKTNKLEEEENPFGIESVDKYFNCSMTNLNHRDF